jgi:hypothetical protein
MFVRFVIARRDMRSDQRVGVFSALYEMEDAGELASHELEWFAAIDRWFDHNMKRPSRFAWSNRPNAPRRAITWLKMSAKEHVNQMRQLVSLLEHKDIDVEELRTDKPGYVVYEDEFQVAAIPFSHETLKH